MPSAPGGKHPHHNSSLFHQIASLQLFKQGILGNVNVLAFIISPLAVREYSSSICSILHLYGQDLFLVRVQRPNSIILDFVS